MSDETSMRQYRGQFSVQCSQQNRKKFECMHSRQLLSGIKKLASEERRLLKELLEYLQEVELRKLHLELGYTSLFAFCTDFLNYSEQEAHVRIQAMRLAKTVPHVKEHLASGDLSLSVAAKVQAHIARDNKIRISEGAKPIDKSETLGLVEAIKNKSVRQSEEILSSIFPHHAEIQGEKIRSIGSDSLRLEINISRETYENLEQLRNLRGANSYSELIRELCELGLKKWGKISSLKSAENGKANGLNEVRKSQVPKVGTVNRTEAGLIKEASAKQKSLRTSQVVSKTSKPRTRYIPMHIRRTYGCAMGVVSLKVN